MLDLINDTTNNAKASFKGDFVCALIGVLHKISRLSGEIMKRERAQSEIVKKIESSTFKEMKN